MSFYKNIFRLHTAFLLYIMVNTVIVPAQISQEKEIENTINRFFKAKQKGDMALLDEMTVAEATFTTITNENRPNEVMDKTQLMNASIMIASNLPGTEEKLTNLNTRTDQYLATTTADYSYFLNGKFTHCGQYTINLTKKSGKWRIMSSYETRHRDQCNNPTEEEINWLMDNWHLSAAKADAKTFFGSMAENGIYLGTDATERWTRDEMKVWAAKYFERGSAWDFKPIERKVYFSNDKRMAYFNETLNTWMGVCRGSGTLTKTTEGWKILQYHLAVTVPNDLIDGFIKLVDAPGRKK